jgi:RecB family exonuclease
VKLSLLRGPAQSGKLVHAIECLNSDTGETLVVCATTAQESDIGRSFAVQTQSFSGFASSLWNRWGDTRVLVGSAIRLKTIDELLDSWPCDKGKIPPSFLSAGGRSFLSKIVASSIPESENPVQKDLNAVAGNYDKIIRILLESYHSKLKSDGYIEHQYAISLLTERLREGRLSLSADKIIITGFRDFTLAQFNLILAIAHVSKIIVVLDWEEGNPATDYLGHTARAFLERGAELLKVHTSNDSSDVLRWLQSNFLKESASPIQTEEKDHRFTGDFKQDSAGKRVALSSLASPGADTLAIGKAQGRDAEIALMLDFAEEEHRTHPHEQKALLVPRLQAYLRPLTREFERRGIPFELDVKTPFSSTGFGSTLLALLRICLDEDTQAAASAFVVSPYSGLSPDEALELDTRWRRYRITNTAVLSQLALHESEACLSLKLIRSYDMSARIGDWSSLITQLYAQAANEQFRSSKNKSSTQSNFDLMQEAAAQKAAISALQELYEQKLAEHTRQNAQAGDAEANREADADEDDKQPGRRILSYDPRISAAEIYASLREAIVAQTPNPASPAILIAEPARIYGRRFHSVIAGGLAATDSRARSDIPLDARLAAGLAETSPADIGQQEELGYYSIVAAATKRLCFVAQSETLAGEELKMGEFLSAVESCLGKEQCKKLTRYKLHDEIIATQSFANAEKQKEIQRLLSGKPVAQVRKLSYGLEAQYDFGYNKETAISPTTLEDYAYCSYRWFLQRYARGKEIERGFDLREQGNFAHKVLKTFYEKLRSSGIGRRINKANFEDALQLYEQVFHKEQELLKEKFAFTPSEEAELVQIHHQIKNFLHSERNYAPEFTPTYLEYPFGVEGSEALDLGLGLPLQGVIDRVDVREDDRAAIIIDYKRTINMGGLQAQAKNKVMQGVLYRNAAAKVLGVRPVAHVYRSYADSSKSSEAYTKDDNPPTRPLGLPPIMNKKHPGLPQEKADELLSEIMNAATLAAAGLSEGEVKIRDKSGDKCRYCLFDACAYSKQAWRG